MFIVLWVVMGVVLGGCAGLLLIAGLQLSREARASDAPWSTLDQSGNTSLGGRGQHAGLATRSA